MHSSSVDSTPQRPSDVGDVLVALSALVVEGRIPGKTATSKNRGFYEGPHCCNVLTLGKEKHECNGTDQLCKEYDNIKNEVLNLWKKKIPMCIDVLLLNLCANNCTADGKEENCEKTSKEILLEKWYFSITANRSADTSSFNFNQLINAIRSQLYFSQISAWLASQDQDTANEQLKLSEANIKYNLTIPGETFERCEFSKAANKHVFPSTEIGNGFQLCVTLMSLPRMAPPNKNCPKCTPPPPPPPALETKCQQDDLNDEIFLLDDRMHLKCTLKGKHRCDDVDEFELRKERVGHFKRVCCYGQAASTSKQRLDTSINSSEKRNASSSAEQIVKTPKLDLKSKREYKNPHQCCSARSCSSNNNNNNNYASNSRSDVFLQAILRSCRLQDETLSECTNDTASYTESANGGSLMMKCDVKCVQKLGEIGTSILNGCAKALQSVSDINSDKNSNKRDIESSSKNNKLNIYVDDHCDTKEHRVTENQRQLKKMRDISNLQLGLADEVDANSIDKEQCSDKQKAESNIIDIPSPNAKAKFRKSLDSAANMVFHARTGLPLTSSPAPVRRGKFRFDFDSSINTVADIRSALFSTSLSTDDDSESDGSIVSPCSPVNSMPLKKQPSPVKQYRRSNAANLLGSFEESVLNGRLEPVSTVHGFTAELGASGSFVPHHLFVPVTVFFYTLGDNDKISSPYLGHINLGKKGYLVPNQGTLQVTLFNPLGTVVKMFVIMYDLSDMPPNSQTFIRQRTLYMPTKCQDQNLDEWGPKWLRYLIHLRFLSSKSGRTYLHSDVRMIIFRKSDMDTATAHGIDMCYELRSFTHMPSNPKYSPRK